MYVILLHIEPVSHVFWSPLFENLFGYKVTTMPRMSRQAPSQFAPNFLEYNRIHCRCLHLGYLGCGTCRPSECYDDAFGRHNGLVFDDSLKRVSLLLISAVSRLTIWNLCRSSSRWVRLAAARPGGRRRRMPPGRLSSRPRGPQAASRPVRRATACATSARIGQSGSFDNRVSSLGRWE